MVERARLGQRGLPGLPVRRGGPGAVEYETSAIEQGTHGYREISPGRTDPQGDAESLQVGRYR